MFDIIDANSTSESVGCNSTTSIPVHITKFYPQRLPLNVTIQLKSDSSEPSSTCSLELLFESPVVIDQGLLESADSTPNQIWEG